MEEIPDKIVKTPLTPNQLEQRISEYYSTVHAGTLEVKDATNLSSTEIDKYLTYWESIRSEIFISKVNVARILSDYRNQLSDGMRTSLTAPARALDGGKSHYDERRARYETDNIDLIKRVRILERLKEEHDQFLEFMKYKDIWLRSLLNGIREKEKQLYYTPKKVY